MSNISEYLEYVESNIIQQKSIIYIYTICLEIFSNTSNHITMFLLTASETGEALAGGRCRRCFEAMEV
jgi:hypothetical protein